MNFAPYPKYTSTDDDFIGEVPRSWGTIRLKFLLAQRLKYGANESAELDDPSFPRFVRITDIDEDGGLRSETFRSLPPEVAQEFYLTAGDILLARSGATVGKSFLYRQDWGLCAYAGYLIRARLNPEMMLPEFLKYFLTSDGYFQWINSIQIQTTIQNVSAEKYGDLKVPRPPISEQKSIVKFLDHKTTQIDFLIRKKEELIEKLREKRSALISLTVACGLPPEAARAAGFNPHPGMKDSGIEWLGMIPEHWGTRRLRHISDGITVGVVVNPSSYVSDEGVPFLLGGDVRDFVVNFVESNRCPKEISDGPLRKSRLSSGDLVVVRVGYPGVAAVVPPELDGANCASMMIVRHHARFCSQWLAYAFNSRCGRDQVEIVQYGAAQKQFNISHAVDFWLPFPPLAEQEAIANYLDCERKKLETLITRIEAALSVLQEYRSALITAAVTGKIDVRDYTRD